MRIKHFQELREELQKAADLFEAGRNEKSLELTIIGLLQYLRKRNLPERELVALEHCTENLINQNAKANSRGNSKDWSTSILHGQTAAMVDIVSQETGCSIEVAIKEVSRATEGNLSNSQLKTLRDNLNGHRAESAAIKAYEFFKSMKFRDRMLQSYESEEEYRIEDFTDTIKQFWR